MPMEPRDPEYDMIAWNFRRLLRRKNMTQAELARRAGLTRRYIGHICQGRSIPNHSQKRKIADALGVPPSDLEYAPYLSTDQDLIEALHHRLTPSNAKAIVTIQKWMREHPRGAV